MISISLIIPTYLRQNIVLNTLKELGNQSVQQFEVTVVDQSPTYNSNLIQYKYDECDIYSRNFYEIDSPVVRWRN